LSVNLLARRSKIGFLTPMVFGIWLKRQPERVYIQQ
jgi:hypothetical protein